MDFKDVKPQMMKSTSSMKDGDLFYFILFFNRNCKKGFQKAKLVSLVAKSY